MVDLPAGTVTFLFTDIEGSTQLLKQLRTRYDEIIADHHSILRRSFEEHRGREVDTQGDSFFVVFARAGDAVASAIAAQRALGAHTWPDGVRVLVRMGLHSGEPRAAGERYIGFGVHRAARIAAAGHGGQILVSNATRELIEDELPPGTRVRDLGSYELKDVDRPERLFQVEADGLATDFPPVAVPRVDAPRHVARVAIPVAIALAAIAGFAIFWSVKEDTSTLGTPENPITIATPWFREDLEQKAFVEVIDAFESTTGIEIDVQADGNVDAESPPTLAFARPGLIAEYVQSGAKPLASLGLADGVLEQGYARTWIDLGTVDGQTYAIPTSATSKSLVWYRPRDFGRLGLRVPKTWNELLFVTRRYERVRRAPWALSAADTFTLTDWFENVYIRREGEFKYDALFAGKLPFDDPSVVAALRQMTTLLSERHVAGGIRGAVETSFPDSVEAVFGSEPTADLLMEGGFVGPFALAAVTPSPRPGTTIAAAPFPTIDPKLGNPVVVGGDFIMAFADDEVVRRLLAYLISPGAGRIWVSTGTVVSPNQRVPLSSYPNALVRTAAAQVTTAKVVRFDGSDLLPGMLADDLGSTLQQVIQFPTTAPRLMSDFQRKAARVFAG